MEDDFIKEATDKYLAGLQRLQRLEKEQHKLFKHCVIDEQQQGRVAMPVDELVTILCELIPGDRDITPEAVMQAWKKKLRRN